MLKIFRVDRTPSQRQAGRSSQLTGCQVGWREDGLKKKQKPDDEAAGTSGEAARRPETIAVS